jgi:hypothetical protein
VSQSASSTKSPEVEEALGIASDGSVDLYLQADSPGIEASWLPTPKAKFGVMLRLYWPKEAPTSIIDGTWTPPAIKKVG